MRSNEKDENIIGVVAGADRRAYSYDAPTHNGSWKQYMISKLEKYYQKRESFYWAFGLSRLPKVTMESRCTLLFHERVCNELEFFRSGSMRGKYCCKQEWSNRKHCRGRICYMDKFRQEKEYSGPN